VLLGSSEAWQRELYELALRLARRGHDRLRCRLEHPGETGDIDDIEGERALADCRDPAIAVLVAESKQCIGLAHASPGQWTSKQPFHEDSDVRAFFSGFG
jgi:hypothetical protein